MPSVNHWRSGLISKANSGTLRPVMRAKVTRASSCSTPSAPASQGRFTPTDDQLPNTSSNIKSGPGVSRSSTR